VPGRGEPIDREPLRGAAAHLVAAVAIAVPPPGEAVRVLVDDPEPGIGVVVELRRQQVRLDRVRRVDRDGTRCHSGGSRDEV
jgi:hypothetical protein